MIEENKTIQAFFDILRKTQAEKNSSKIFKKTQANNSKTQ